MVRDIQENFRPALGFVQRDNVRLFRAAFSYNPRPKDFLNIQQMNHDVYYTHFTRLDNGETESWDLYVTLLDWHFKSGDNLHGMIDFNPTYERLFEPFEISPGVMLPAGRVPLHALPQQPAVDRHQAPPVGQHQLPLRRLLVGRGGAGDRQRHLQAAAAADAVASAPTRRSRGCPKGDFIARIFTANVNYAFSPTLSFSNLVQYDNRSRNLGWQSRVRWTPQPGNDLFVAFNQGWIQEEGREDLRFRVEDTRISAKIQYSVRF